VIGLEKEERYGSDMMDLTVREIAEACGGELVLRQGISGDECVTSVVIDSRKAEAGGVFLATIGEQVDGHRYIPAVFAKGGILAVTQKTPEQVEREHGCRAEEWGSYLLVEDTLQALEDIAEAYRKKISVKIVGLTGSSGKTSTKEFIAAVLARRYQVCKTQGNLNNEIGVPLTLLGIRGEEVAVVEMGISDFGEMHRLSKMVRPDVCVITNIGLSHLKDLKTRDGILKAKSEIFDYMAEDGEICLNGEDDKLIGLEEIKGHKPHFFGLGGNPGEEVAAEEIAGNLWGSDATLVFRERADFPGKFMQSAGMASCRQASGTVSGAELRQPIHVPLPGVHMVLNAAAAACVGRLFGLTGEEIAEGIAGVTPVNGRANILRLPHYTLIDDCYNANPESMSAALDLLALADTEKVAILGDMFNLGENSHELHARMGRHAVQAGIDHVICVGEESRYMYEAAGGTEAVYFPTRQEFMAVLATEPAKWIPEGSTVLIKASHGMAFSEILEFLEKLDGGRPSEMM